MSNPQQAGFLDRVFNSTISLPQQVIWRIWRALEDEDVDLFSEQGLLDAALLPGLGIMDDHQEDVMPDYMAQQLGMGDGFVGQMSAAILSDPLTYLTGGLSAAGKVGTAVGQSRRAPTLKKLLRGAAETAGQNLDEFSRITAVDDLVPHIDEAMKELKSGPMTKKAKQELKTLDRMQRDLAAHGGDAAKELGPAPTLHDALQSTRQRQIAIGLPGLATFGAKFNVAEGYSSWWTAFKDGVRSGGTGLSKALLTNKVVESMPGVSKALRNVTAPARHAVAGWKVGGEPLVSFSHAAAQMSDDELAALTHWTNRAKGAGNMVPDMLKLNKKGDAKALVVKEYRRNIAAGLSHEESFRKAFSTAGIGKRGETGAALWGRLTGRGAESTAFPKWGDKTKGAKAIEGAMDTAVTRWQQASALAADGRFNIHPESTELGRVSRVFHAELEEKGETMAFLAEKAFDTASAFKKTLNMAFKTGEASTHGQKVYADFLAHTARDNDQLETLAAGLYKRVAAIVKEDGHSLSANDIGTVFEKLIELQPLPGELAQTFHAATINEQGVAAATESLSNFLKRHRRVMDSFEKMLLRGGISDGAVRERILASFDDQVFPFMEREAEVAGSAKIRVAFRRLITKQSRTVEELTPLDQIRMRRANNKHVIRGAGIEVPGGDPIYALERFAGKKAAFLDDADLDDALKEIEGYGLRDMTPDEIVGAAKEIPAFEQFTRRHSLTPEEGLQLLRRTGKGQARRVPRTEMRQPQLWEEGRMGWTGQQADDHLAQYGLRLTKAEDGTLALVPDAVTEATLRRRYGWKRGDMKGFNSIRAAMAQARKWLGEQGDYVKRHGPADVETRADLNVPTSELDDLKKLLSTDDLTTLRGRRRLFDETRLPQDLGPDFARLRELRRRRQLPADHRLHEPGPVVPQRRVEVTDSGAPRTGADLRLFMEDNGVILTEDEMSEWATEYSRGRLLVRELQRALGRARAAGTALDFDPQLLSEIDNHVATSGKIIEDMVMGELPPSVTQLWDDVRRIQTQQFEEARRAGVWIPGSPVGYLPRYFNKNGRAKIASIIGDIEQTDGRLLVRLGIKQAQRFGRSLDSFSLDDLNDIHAEVRALTAEEGADKVWASYMARIEHEMKRAGVPIAGGAGRRGAYDSKRLVDDPFLSLLQRLGASNQNKTLEQYWDNMLAASDTAPGESMMLGGKVVGVIDNTGKTRNVKSARAFPARTTLRKPSQNLEVVDLTNEAADLEYTPQSIVIETAKGERHVVPTAMLDETGFGLLDLGAADELEALGYTPTLGQNFAKASLRSDLHESIFQGVLQGGQAEGLLGRHVVFGAQNLMASAIKASAKVHEVTAPALRTFDSVNYLIKTFQTIFRLPFHIANLTSGVFQTMLAGASPKNVAAAYVDTMRLMGGNQQRLAQAAGALGDMLGTDETVSNGVLSLLKGNRTEIQRLARMQGNGDLAKHLDALQDAGIDEIESLVIKHADGTETDLVEFLQLAGEMELYGTFASSLTRGSRTVGENLVRIKMDALEPTLGGRIKGLPGRTLERMRNVSETSEVFNRTATALALVREGHPMRRAIEIAKEAHVPYEKLTPFERNYMKRLSVYYAFPRHYMPWAWARFAEDPKKLSVLAHTMRDQKLLASQEGRPTLVLGDMRLDVGRLNANMEAAGMLAAFADRIVMPAAEIMPGIDSVDPRDLIKAQSDAGLTSVGGVASMLGWKNMVPQGERTQGGAPDLWGDAVNIIWPIKIAAQIAGKVPSKEEGSPYVDYTPLESWLTDSNFGLGLRKVKPQHELQQAIMAYRKEVRKLQLRAAATEDEGKRERLLDHVRTLTTSLGQIQADSQQKTD